MNQYATKWIYIVLSCGLLFSTSLYADRGFYHGGRFNHSSGFYHNGNYYYPPGFYQGQGHYFNADGDGYYKSGFYHDKDYYHGNGPGWGGSHVIINGGAYAPAYNPLCRWVTLCDANQFCEQRQVCHH